MSRIIRQSSIGTAEIETQNCEYILSAMQAVPIFCFNSKKILYETLRFQNAQKRNKLALHLK